MQKGELKKNWAITPEAFRRLLDWLDAGKNSDGENYLNMRRRLVNYFDRKDCLAADELADETLNRVARRLEEEGDIEGETPARFCYITARFIFLENLRGIDQLNVSLDSALHPSPINPQILTFRGQMLKEESDKLLECLEHCLARLEPATRDIIINYYYGAERVKIENRRALAQKLSISSNALTIRACRIRENLEICIDKCTGET